MATGKGQVPETVLKKRKRNEDWAAKKAAAIVDAKKKSKTTRKEIFKRAEQYVKEYRDQVGVAAIEIALGQPPYRPVLHLGSS